MGRRDELVSVDTQLVRKEFVMETAVNNAWELFIDETDEETEDLPQNSCNVLAW